MQRFALNFICKNESHIIREMLHSIQSLSDLIVAVDTGSSDNTIAIIQEFGLKYQIPTYVFERPFDNFCNSRNYALDKLKEVVNHLGWDHELTWGFWIDCDEKMVISQKWKKENVTVDLYYSICIAEDINFTRQLLFRLSKQLFWEGPIHEHIMSDDPTITCSLVEGLHVYIESIGASWKGNLAQKFITYADKLKAYVSEGHHNFRWIFYIANSYSAAAIYTNSKNEKKQFFLEAKHYYREAKSFLTLNRDERYRVNYRIAENDLFLETRWSEVQYAFLNTYAVDKRHAEPMESILKHYIETNQWEIAYLFSSFSVANYHQKWPTGDDVIEIRASLYKWKILFYHYFICLQSAKKKEGLLAYGELKNILKDHPGYFRDMDILTLKINTPSMILWRTRIQRLKHSTCAIFQTLLSQIHELKIKVKTEIYHDN